MTLIDANLMKCNRSSFQFFKSLTYSSKLILFFVSIIQNFKGDLTFLILKLFEDDAQILEYKVFKF
jgi:hypothetical protein